MPQMTNVVKPEIYESSIEFLPSGSVNLESDCFKGWIMAEEGTAGGVGVKVLVNGNLLVEIKPRDDVGCEGGAPDGQAVRGFAISAGTIIQLADNRGIKDESLQIEMMIGSASIHLQGSPFYLSRKDFPLTPESKRRHIRGSIDFVSRNLVNGWIADKRFPGRSLLIEIYHADQCLGVTTADGDRKDLKDALGGAKHGFSYRFKQEGALISPELLWIREPQSGEAIFPVPSVLDAMEKRINFDGFVGHMALGWSIGAAEVAQTIVTALGGKNLGRVKSDLNREDVRAAFDLDSASVGFRVMLGGVLQFSAVAKDCATLTLKQFSAKGAIHDIDLRPYWPEGLTYSPLKSFARPLDVPAPGIMHGARLASDLGFSILIEAGSNPINGESLFIVDCYQESTPGSLARIGQFSIELAGQVANLEFRILSREAPILLIVTDAFHNIIATDCIPLPAIYMERYSPLIEYHSLLAGGQRAFDVAAKIGRSYLDYFLKRRNDPSQISVMQPNLHNTAVILFSRNDFDWFPGVDNQFLQHVSKEVVFLNRKGLIGQGMEGEQAESFLDQYMDQSNAEFFFLCEVNDFIRPDFWSIFDLHRNHLKEDVELVYWDSVVLDGTSRPLLFKNRLLSHAAFRRHTLSPINSILVRRKSFKEALSLHREDFASGKLQLEKAFYFLSEGTATHLPVVMDTFRVQLPPANRQKCWNEQIPISDIQLSEPKSIADVAKADGCIGVSVIINYRNSVDTTIRCMESVRLQEMSVPLEVVLINNGSTRGNANAVVNKAISLFGEANVKAIDYNQPFNHSEQSNLAAEAARYNFLLMLSNDSILISSDTIMRSLEVAGIPWVGTCGFRVVSKVDNKSVLQSLGLKLSDSRYLFAGAGPLATNCRPPQFACDFTIEVAGNTFAAVMVRKDVYMEIGGLDGRLFPTNYNDVDFCLRALAKGYRHITVGGCLVAHVGRGSREMDLDLPINQNIFSSMPSYSTLNNLYSIQSL
jgi:GT2 family glycosyltransferase